MSSSSPDSVSAAAEEAVAEPLGEQVTGIAPGGPVDLSQVKEGPFFFKRRFFPMWSGFVLGVFTDNMLKQALLIGLTYQVITLPGVADTESAMPLAAVLFAVAMFLFSPIAGQVADKNETGFMFRWTKFAEFVLMAVAALGFVTSNGYLLMAVLFCMGIQSSFFSPVRVSAMPKYLHPTELVRGNAFSYGGLFVANLLGYAIGGGFIETDNGPVIISILLILMALAGWRVVHLAPPAPADAPDIRIDWNIFRQMGVMARMVLDEPPVVRPIIGVGLFWFIASAITVAFPLINKGTLNTDGTVTTAFMVIFGIGGMIGGAIATGMSKGTSGLQFSTMAIIIGIVTNLILYGICLAMDGTTTGDPVGWTEFFSRPVSWVLAILFVIASASMCVYMVPLQAAVQRRVKERHRARIMAAANMFNALMAIPGGLLVWLIAITPARPHDAFIIIALIEIAIVVYMFRRKAAVPEGLYDEVLKEQA